MPKSFILLLFTVLFFSSCTSERFIYSPAPPNNPVFTEKGESKLSAYYSGGSSKSHTNANPHNRGFDLQGAYAIGEHIAITADYFSRKEADYYKHEQYDIFDSSIVAYKRNLLSFGGGYFKVINESQTVTVNILGGAGFGKFSFTDLGIDENETPYSRYHEAKLVKWHITPSINTKTGECSFSFVPRVSFVYFNSTRTNYTQEEIAYFQLNQLEKKGFAFFEPGFNVRLGIREIPWIKLDTWVNICSNTDLPKLRARGANASIGLSFDFSKMK